MIIYGELIQTGEPTPTNPIPIETKNYIKINDEYIEMTPILKEKDIIYKGKDGKWYLRRDGE